MTFLQWLKSWGKETVVIDTLRAYRRDADDIMLHASFQILKNWIEYEKGVQWWAKGLNPMDLPEGPLKDIYGLYLWWTVERPQREASQPPGMDTITWERQCDEEDQAKLLALVAFRGYLWT